MVEQAHNIHLLSENLSIFLMWDEDIGGRGGGRGGIAEL